MTKIAGPVLYSKSDPLNVYIGESFKLRTPVRDGDVSTTVPYGSLIDVSAGTIKGILRIYKPDGTTNVTRDTSVSGEGQKTDAHTSGYEDSFDFFVADTVTDLWTNGLTVRYEVEYQSTAPTPDDILIIEIGYLKIQNKPSVAG